MSYLKILFRAYSSLLFIDNFYIGMILFVSTFINYSIGISGLISIISALIFSAIINLKEEFLIKNFYMYNSLLVGMSIGYLFMPSLLSFLLISILSIFTFLLSFALNRIFYNYGIPILSLPFSIVTVFSYLATIKYSNLLTTLIHNNYIFDIQLPILISSFLKALGEIFFLPNNIIGLIIISLLFFNSRIMGFIAIFSFYFGVYIHSLFLGSFNEALVNIYAFNYIITGIALFGIFLIPSIRTFFITLIAILINVILSDSMSVFFNYYNISVFTIPFNITATIILFTLFYIKFNEYNYFPLKNPEESFKNFLRNFFKFKKEYIKIYLPFSGVWNVYQGFNGKWTHKGSWKYAYDFVIKKNGKTYEREGYLLKDYYSFGESILSPVSGYVIACRHDLPDNKIGEVDRVNNWGNYIIFRSNEGYIVEISHLMQYSLLVDIGSYIEIGNIIAKCGNSGYSPEPHIHIQVQKYTLLGSETIPFLFSDYIENKVLYFNKLPKEDSYIENIILNKFFAEKFYFSLDEEYKYQDENENLSSWIVKMNDFSEFYFEDQSHNKLFFYNSYKEIIFYKYIGKKSLLKEIYGFIQRIPFTNKKLSFLDYNIKDSFIYLGIFNKKLLLRNINYNITENKIFSKYGEIEFDPYIKGFKNINIKNKKYRRV